MISDPFPGSPLGTALLLKKRRAQVSSHNSQHLTELPRGRKQIPAEQRLCLTSFVHPGAVPEDVSRSDGGVLASTRKLCNSNIYNTNMHFLFQTNILCSSGNAPVVLPTIAPLSMVLFSPVLAVLSRDNVLLQRLSTDTGNRLPPSTAPCSVVTGRPTTGLL